MCNHSYHQRYVSSYFPSSQCYSRGSLFGITRRCLAENETECPNCARDHGMIREIRRNNERLADQHDLFLSEVREGGFAALAAGFGRGTLSMARVDDVVV